MRRRHPHVFSTQKYESENEQKNAWEQIKAEERESKSGVASSSVMDGVDLGLPANVRAKKLQKRARTVGFDWQDHIPVFSKIEEELQEIREAVASNDDRHIEEEIGDILFACVNLARHLNVDPEAALRNTNRKFELRFRAMERLASERGKVFSQLTLVEQEALWQEVKALV